MSKFLQWYSIICIGNCLYEILLIRFCHLLYLAVLLSNFDSTTNRKAHVLCNSHTSTNHISSYIFSYKVVMCLNLIHCFFVVFFWCKQLYFIWRGHDDIYRPWSSKMVDHPNVIIYLDDSTIHAITFNLVTRILIMLLLSLSLRWDHGIRHITTL